MSRDLKSLSHSVNDPTKDELACSPASVTLEHLLQGDSFVPVGFIQGGLSEDVINGVKEVSSDDVHASFATLSYLDEVIHEDISGAQGALERHVRSR